MVRFVQSGNAGTGDEKPNLTNTLCGSCVGRYQKGGTDALFQHPVIKPKKVNEENRNGEWSLGRIVAPIQCNVGQHMNTIAQHTDYSLMLGLVTAVAGLCIMLMAWLAAKTLWKVHQRAQLERKWRRAKGY